MLLGTASGHAQAFPGDEGGPGLEHEHGGKKRFEAMEKKITAMMDQIMSELNLTAEQQEQIKQFHETMRTGGKQAFEKMRTNEKALREELEKYDSDMNKINGLVEELTAQHKDMLEHRVEGILFMKRILTQEQFEKLQQKMQEKRKEWHKNEKHGRRGMPSEAGDGPEECE